MIASWMLYCSLCAFGLTLAAALAERALLRGRGPVRVVWIGAVLLSLVVPAVALRFAPRPAEVASPAIASDEVAADPVFVQVTQQTTENRVAGVTLSNGEWRRTLARWDDVLFVVWVTLSIAVAFNFFGGVLVLAWMRRRWQRRDVLGVAVYVSERTGPAVVGALSPAIVVPHWVLALEPAQLALMLRHEEEHRLAGDGRLLTLAQLALIVMPWNLALWWQIFRLRVAVELDCDARVLRAADARSYGDLLLEFARPRRGPSLVGVTAFAERAAQLERRIRLLSRHRARTPRAARALATSIGIAALTVAWVAPRPPVPARARVERTDVDRFVPAPLTAPPEPDVAPPPAPEKPAKPPAAVPSPMARMTLPPCGSAAGRVDARLSDVIFDRLFDGITLSAAQATKACALLAKLEQQQAAEDGSANTTLLANRERAQTLRVQRDSALRALLTSDAERAAFEARMAQGGLPGGRGRSNGAGLDSLLAGRRGGGAGADLQPGGRQGGRGARGGGAGRGAESPNVVFAEVNNLLVDMMFRRYFEGITLTAEQETAARALIAQTQEDIRVQNQPRVPVLRVDNRSGLVTMSEASAAELNGLLSSDADKATLQARIVSVPAR